MFSCRDTSLTGVLIFEPSVYPDQRGFFLETYQQQEFVANGVARAFVQDNHSRSHRGVLRGLHYQLTHPQGKLVRVVRGEIFDVAVDIRRSSPNFGKWFGIRLTDQNHLQLFIPEGFAHGFCVLSPEADVAYKCTEYYTPGDDRGLLWSDPDIGIDWPIDDVFLSDKDAGLPSLASIDPEQLPR